MKTYKYKFGDQSNTIRLGNLLDDMWQVHVYFHEWQRQRYKDGLPYAGYAAMCAHLTELKRTTHPHWNALPSQAIKVSDLAFYQFVEIMKYKCQKHKCLLKQVDQWTATTKPCSDCGFHNENLTLSDRQWTCPECGSHHDRDINAALNILQAGIPVKVSTRYA